MSEKEKLNKKNSLIDYKKRGGIMRNKEQAISYILFGGILGSFLFYSLFSKESLFVGALVGGLLGYFLSQKK